MLMANFLRSVSCRHRQEQIYLRPGERRRVACKQRPTKFENYGRDGFRRAGACLQAGGTARASAFRAVDLRPAFVNQRLPPQWSHTTTGKETQLLLPPQPAIAVLHLCCLVTLSTVYTVHAQVTERSSVRDIFFFIFDFFRRRREGDKLTECSISTADCA
jgi:hypothetical protein